MCPLARLPGYLSISLSQVYWYVDNKEKQVYNVIDEVKSLAVEEDRLYTVKDQDLIVSQKTASGKGLVNKATIPGRYPLILGGPKNGNKHAYILCCTRDGKGVTLIKNESPFTQLWTKEVGLIFDFEYHPEFIMIFSFSCPGLP